MTNHWSSLNHTTLTDLADLHIHQPASSHNFKGSLTKLYSEVRCGLYVLPRLLYHVTSCVWSYSSKPCNCLAFIHQHAVTCKYQVCNTSSPTHILALNSCHPFQRNLTFQGVERKVPPAAPQAWLIQRRIIQSQKSFCGDLATRNPWTCW